MLHKFTIILLLLFSLMMSSQTSAHVGGHGLDGSALRMWTNSVAGERVLATFLFVRDGQVHLERFDGCPVTVPVHQLIETDQQYITARQSRVAQLNAPPVTASISQTPIILWLWMLTSLMLFWLIRRTSNLTQRRIVFSGAVFLLLCLTWTTRQQAQTNRPAMALPFDVFSPKVTTRWDDKYLYVESNGIPDHPLMAGIKT